MLRILWLGLALLWAQNLEAQIFLVETGGNFGDDNLALDGTPFASDTLVGFEDVHNVAFLNDGLYGNANSWIGEVVEPGFCGIDLGGAFTLRSLAFGRDNDGVFIDRSLGLYRVQFTRAENPDELTPDEDWIDLGELEYGAFCPPQPALRHRYNFEPIQDVTGIRILVPGVGIAGGTCIDEIEVYELSGEVLESCDDDPGELVLVEEGGEIAAENIARFDGVRPFASSSISVEFSCPEGFIDGVIPAQEGGTFDPESENLARLPDAFPFALDSLAGFPIHDIQNLNDGIYGNSNSWIGDAGFPGFVGLSFGEEVEVRSFAFGRDNGGEANQFRDRSLGLYTVEFTEVESPDETTPDEDWIFLASLDYAIGCPPEPWLRHRFDLEESVAMTGLRILVPGVGIAGGTCIDELEVYGDPTDLDGESTNPPGLLVDGAYGHESAWISGNALPAFAGLAFGRSISIESLAFGRDNGGEETVFTDRTAGIYTIQYTTVETPDETTPEGDWVTVGRQLFDPAAECPRRPSVRHRFNFPAVEATGVRILTPGGAAIDELEVYASPGADEDTCAPPPPPEQELTLVEIGGFFDDGNFALDEGVTPFAIDSLAGFPIHDILNLNDGIYGNTNSWIGNSGNPAFCGLSFPERRPVGSIAFGRDNGGEPNTFMDRSLGLYTLQYTQAENPDESTADTAWMTVAVLDYSADSPPSPWLRHRWDLDEPVEATGVRLLVPGSSIAGGTCVDELEVYEEPCGDDCEAIDPTCPEDERLALLETGGPITTPSLPFDVPTTDDGNLAFEALAFATPSLDAPQHQIVHLNDGSYGNDNSWLGISGGETSGEVYAGIFFEDGLTFVQEIAFGRDNTQTFNDRVFGCPTIEWTADDFAPDDDASVAGASWSAFGIAAGTVEDEAPVGLRRRYSLGEGATVRAVRIVTSVQSVIDEIEVYGGEPPPPGDEFRRGDADGSGGINITDGIAILNFLFLGAAAPGCMEAADVDNSSAVNITDGIALLNFLFLGGVAPAPPGGDNCGEDPDPDQSPGDLGCEDYPACP